MNAKAKTAEVALAKFFILYKCCFAAKPHSLTLKIMLDAPIRSSPQASHHYNGATICTAG